MFETQQYKNLWEEEKMNQPREGEETARYDGMDRLIWKYMEKAGNQLTVLLYQLKDNLDNKDYLRRFQNITLTLVNLNYEGYADLAHRANSMYSVMKARKQRRSAQ